MTVLEILAQVKQLSEAEREALLQLLRDNDDIEPDPHRLLDLVPISLGGLRPGVQLISREEFYDDEDNDGR